MLTEDIVRRLCPHARSDYIDALVNGKPVLDAAGINTPLRMAAFLGTICHETGGLTIVRENTRWSDSNLKIFSKSLAARIRPNVGNARKSANAAYGHRLGNEDDGTSDDDGWDYRGGGMIQLTGKYNYRKAGEAIGVDLGNNPILIENADISLKAACWEFSQFVDYCDRGESGFKAVCNGINRGNAFSKLDPIGWASRQNWYSRACDVIGVSGRTVDDYLRVGDRGELVRIFQDRLKALGYQAGRSDGIFGSRTRAAVLAFQAENGLQTDGIIGPVTRAALNAEAAAPMPAGERADETLDDLREQGSRIVTAADKGVKTIATVGASTVIYAVSQGVDALTGAGDLLKEITTLKTLTMGFTDALSFFQQHWYLIVILVAYLLYRQFKSVQSARLDDHQTGANASR
jgi:putative chitinase